MSPPKDATSEEDSIGNDPLLEDSPGAPSTPPLCSDTTNDTEKTKLLAAIPGTLAAEDEVKKSFFHRAWVFVRKYLPFSGSHTAKYHSIATAPPEKPSPPSEDTPDPAAAPSTKPKPQKTSEILYLDTLGRWVESGVFVVPVAVLFGTLDGLSNFLSAESQYVKYRFNKVPNTKKLLRDFLSGHAGITIGGAVFVVTFSIAGNLFRVKDEKKYRRLIACAWPVLREVVFKAPKNSYSGIFGALAVAKALGRMDVDQVMDSVFLPGIILGVLSAVTSGYARGLRDNRKAMMESNKNLLDEIRGMTLVSTNKSGETKCMTIDPKSLEGNSKYWNELKECKHRMQQQKKYERRIGYFFAAYNGAIDGMYRFIGPMSLVIDTNLSLPLSFSRELLVFMLVMAVIYAATNIIAYVYDEHMYQKKLIDFDAKIDHMICTKEFEFLLQISFEALKLIQYRRKAIQNGQLVTAGESVETIKKMLDGEKSAVINKLEKKQSELTTKRKKLLNERLLDKIIAILGGLNAGMAVYGAMVSFLFLVVFIQELKGGSKFLHPWGLASFMIIGTVLMACFILRVWKTHAEEAKVTQKEKAKATPEYGEDAGICNYINKCKQELIKDSISDAFFDQTNYQEIIQNSLVIDEYPSSEVQQFAEVGRNLVYAPSKITKLLRCINGIQPDSDSFSFAKKESEQSNKMAWCAVFLAIVAGIIFMLKAIGKYFGRDSNKTGAATSPTSAPPLSPSSYTQASSMLPDIEKEDRFSEVSTGAPASTAPRITKSFSVEGFFSGKTPEFNDYINSRSLRRSSSAVSLR